VLTGIVVAETARGPHPAPVAPISEVVPG
jgi:hypothetical protein